jgi:hypothetical protein
MDSEGTSALRTAFNGDIAYHSFDHALGERKAEAAAMNLRGSSFCAAIERIKNLLHLIGRDANAAIRDRDQDF